MPLRRHPFLNRGTQTLGGLPFVHGDLYRPVDRILENLQILGKVGDVVETLFNFPSILEGLNVTQIAAQQIQVTAGTGVFLQREVDYYQNHMADGTPILDSSNNPEPLSTPGAILLTPLVNTTNVTLTSSGPFTGTWYVKLRYKPKTVQQRNLAASPSVNYAYAQEDDCEIIVNTASPTAKDLLLATLTRNSSGDIVSISTNQPTDRAPNTRLIIPNSTFSFGNNVVNLSGTFTAPRTVTFPDEDIILGNFDDYKFIDVFSNVSIASGKIVKFVDRNVSLNLPVVNVVNSRLDIPFGYVYQNIVANTQNRVIRNGIYQVTGFNTTSSTIGNFVYCDENGDLTLDDTGIIVGYVASLNANGHVYFDLDNIYSQNFKDTRITLNNNSEISLDSNSLFPPDNSGYFVIYDISDKNTFINFYKNSGPNSTITIVSSSSNVVLSDTSGNLCLYQVSGDTRLKNRLGTTKTFRIFRGV